MNRIKTSRRSLQCNRRPWPWLWALLFLTISSSSATLQAAEIYSLDACVARMLANHPKLGVAQTGVERAEAHLAQLQANLYPQLKAHALLAPMYTVRGSALEANVEERYKSLGDWGPYTRFLARVVWPLTTFGRLQAGLDAISAKKRVEEAKLREVEGLLVLEVHKLYNGFLLAASILPAIEQAEKGINTAQVHAKKLYEEGKGEVSQADLMRLRHGQYELEAYRLKAVHQREMAKRALAFALGLGAQAQFELASKKLPRLPPRQPQDEPQSLAAWQTLGAEKRPEWLQLKEGWKAAKLASLAESRRDYPTLFLAGEMQGAWTPTRDNATNPYHRDPFNFFSAGLALGLNFDIAPWTTLSNRQQTLVQEHEVAALNRMADTGIPLQITNAYEQITHYQALVKTNKSSVKATRTWFIMALNAFQSGTGDAKETIEGLLALLKARYTYYEGLYQYHIAHAELHYAAGLFAEISEKQANP